MRLKDIPELNRLSTVEKILLVEELWDSIICDGANIPVPQSHRVELDKRLKRHMAHPGELLTLEELQSRLENRK